MAQCSWPRSTVSIATADVTFFHHHNVGHLHIYTPALTLALLHSLPAHNCTKYVIHVSSGTSNPEPCINYTFSVTWTEAWKLQSGLFTQELSIHLPLRTTTGTGTFTVCCNRWFEIKCVLSFMFTFHNLNVLFWFCFHCLLVFSSKRSRYSYAIEPQVKFRLLKVGSFFWSCLFLQYIFTCDFHTLNLFFRPCARKAIG